MNIFLTYFLYISSIPVSPLLTCIPAYVQLEEMLLADKVFHFFKQIYFYLHETFRLSQRKLEFIPVIIMGGRKKEGSHFLQCYFHLAPLIPFLLIVSTFHTQRENRITGWPKQPQREGKPFTYINKDGFYFSPFLPEMLLSTHSLVLPCKRPVWPPKICAPGTHVPAGIPSTHLSAILQQHLRAGDVSAQAGLVESRHTVCRHQVHIKTLRGRVGGVREGAWLGWINAVQCFSARPQRWWSG